MTRKEFRSLWPYWYGNTPFAGRFWKKYRDFLRNVKAQYFIPENFDPYSLAEDKDMKSSKQERMKEDLGFFIECVSGRKIDPMDHNCVKVKCEPQIISLGNCEAATPPLPNKELYTISDPMGNVVEYVWKTPLKNAMQFATKTDCMQEQGNNPMRIDNTTATAYVTTPKSNDAVSRDYLLSRLSLYEGWRNPKLVELSTLFNLGEDGRPDTYLQLIDAIKNDKFTLDDKAVKQLKRLQEDLNDYGDEADFDEYGYGPFYGIVFTDFPKADRKGYDTAVKELEALTKATKDTIMVKLPDEGLTALQALEAWTPAGKAN